MGQKIRIVLAEDHTILRQGLRALLTANDEYHVVGEASNGKEAQQCVAASSPDLVIMDLSMPNTNGTEAIRNIRRRFPEVKIITLTIHKTEEHVRAALKAGSNAYLLKDDNYSELLIAIESVISGKTYLSAAICGGVVAGFLNPSTDTTTNTSWDCLTYREREIIKLIAEGQRNKDVALYLSISLKTVEKHRANIMKKLNLHNASSLTAYAINNGLVN